MVDEAHELREVHESAGKEVKEQADKPANDRPIGGPNGGKAGDVAIAGRRDASMGVHGALGKEAPCGSRSF